MLQQPPCGNIFKNLQYNKKEEIVTSLFKNPLFHVKRITSQGQNSNIFDQEQAEWVVLLEGTATIELFTNRNLDLCENNKTTLSLVAGDWLFIPAHQLHRVINTSPSCIWLCFFLAEQI